MVVRGDRVQFPIWMPDPPYLYGELDFSGRVKPWAGKHLVCPAAHLLCQDKIGEYGRSCDVYVVAKATGKPPRESTEKEREALRELHGDCSVTDIAIVAPPRTGWVRLHRVVGIDYSSADARKFGLPEDYAHPFEGFQLEDEPAIWLYGHKQLRAWKVELPDGCLIDGRGFVRP